MYKPSISKRKKFFKKRAENEYGYDPLDMEKRYASAGPNKQMYEMYNMSMRANTAGGAGPYAYIVENDPSAGGRYA